MITAKNKNDERVLAGIPLFQFHRCFLDWRSQDSQPKSHITLDLKTCIASKLNTSSPISASIHPLESLALDSVISRIKLD